MRIEYDLKFRDQLMFNLFHQFLSLPTQLFFGGMAILFFSLMLKEDSFFVSAASALIMYIAMWIVQVIFLIVYLNFGSYRSLLTKHIIELKDEALLHETAFARSSYFWHGFAKLVRRKGFTAVYMNAGAAHVIPDRAFSSRREREEFISQLREKIANSVR